MTLENSNNNKRIAKNAIALYFRTFVTMIIGLYTGRVMLQALGIDNYGIQNVVGSIVSMSGLITSAMSEAISRYLTFYIGSEEKEKLKLMFSTSINAQIIMSVLAIIVLEIIGLWFIVYQANIPADRIVAAHWVFQCSLVSLAIGLISSPYNALIVAHERMGIYAYTSIADSALKLIICFAIMVYGGDRLILLALLNVAVGMGMRVFYGWYCRKNFEEAHYDPHVFDKSLIRQVTTFSGWNMLNNGAWMFSTQGVNMLVNVFFGVSYNAARGVAQTVNGAVQGFVGNFNVAFAPQITKSYAADDKAYSIMLANRSTRITWLMTYVILVPVFFEADTLLELWLDEVPKWSSLLLRFALFESLAVSSGRNLYRLIQSDGRVRAYTIHAAIMVGLIFPIVWMLFKFGAPIWSAYMVFILVFLLMNVVRIYDIRKLTVFSTKKFINECAWPCLLVSLLSFVVPTIICHLWQPSLTRFILNVPISVLWTCICCFVFGLTKSERVFLLNKASVVFKIKQILIKK